MGFPSVGVTLGVVAALGWAPRWNAAAPSWINRRGRDALATRGQDARVTLRRRLAASRARRPCYVHRPPRRSVATAHRRPGFGRYGGGAPSAIHASNAAAFHRNRPPNRVGGKIRPESTSRYTDRTETRSTAATSSMVKNAGGRVDTGGSGREPLAVCDPGGGVGGVDGDAGGGADDLWLAWTAGCGAVVGGSIVVVLLSVMVPLMVSVMVSFIRLVPFSVAIVCTPVIVMYVRGRVCCPVFCRGYEKIFGDRMLGVD